MGLLSGFHTCAPTAGRPQKPPAPHVPCAQTSTTHVEERQSCNRGDPESGMTPITVPARRCAFEDTHLSRMPRFVAEGSCASVAERSGNHKGDGRCSCVYC